jgi:rsbT antagonist protein RsbS
MAVPILKQGDYLIATIQSAVADADLERLREDLARQVGDLRCRGVVVDVSALDVMDSFTIRTFLDIAHISKLRGADAVIAGIQPDVAFAMVQLGLRLDGVTTALDLDEGLALLARRKRSGRLDVG